MRAASVFCALLFAGCASANVGPEAVPTEMEYAPELGVDFSEMEETGSGLWMKDLSPGTGRTATTGDRIRIHYVGRLPDGTPFDSSLGGDPFEFELGAGGVIRGWTQGIRGMSVGARRLLVIRPGLGYGARGRPPAVPPNSVLVFEIQLLDAN
jgi:FKBP-type peptidyl-prolyl cis-trans isomerase